MARPDVHPTTLRLYQRLPAYLRDADEAQAGPPDYPLLRYLSLLGDQLGEVEDLVDRMDYRHPFDGGTPGDTSDLVDPATADAAWLPWLAQVASVTLADQATEAARRTLIAGANELHAEGSEGAMRAAIRPLLTDTRYVEVVPNFSGTWAIGIVTLSNESAGTTPAAILAAATPHKPAGASLVHDYGLTWADLEATFPTWDAIDAAGSWNNLAP